jgi:hypothetical protein
MGGAVLGSIEAGLGASGAACADAAKVRPTANARIIACISGSVTDVKRTLAGND